MSAKDTHTVKPEHIVIELPDALFVGDAKTISRLIVIWAKERESKARLEAVEEYKNALESDKSRGLNRYAGYKASAEAFFDKLREEAAER